MDLLFDDSYFDESTLQSLEELIQIAEKCAAEAEAETVDHMVESEVELTLEELVTRVCLIEKHERTKTSEVVSGNSITCHSHEKASRTVNTDAMTVTESGAVPKVQRSTLSDSPSSGISSRSSDLSSDSSVSSDEEENTYSPEREWRRYARSGRSRSSGLSTASPAPSKDRLSEASSVAKRKAESPESRRSTPRPKRSRRSRSSSRSSTSSESSTSTFASFDRRCRERSYSPQARNPRPGPWTGRTDVGCSDCRRRYPCIQELAKHEVHSHDKGRVACPFCKKRKDCTDDLIKHLKSKHPSRTLRCPHCKSNHYDELIEDTCDKTWREFRDHVYYEILKVRTYTHSLLNRKGPHFRRGLGSCPHGPPSKCKNFPKCPGRKCYFSHGPCRYDTRCRNEDCPYDHTERPRTCRSCWNELEKYTGIKAHNRIGGNTQHYGGNMQQYGGNIQHY